MALKWTQEKIMKFIENENYKVIKIISGIGKETRLLVWCGNPNHEPYEVIFNNFKRGTRCQSCYDERRRKWTDEKIKEYIEGYNYKLIEIIKSKGIKSLIKIKCLECGYEYMVIFETFRNGARCMQCFLRNNRTSEDEIRRVVESNGDILVDIEYHSLDSVLYLYCEKCKKVYTVIYYWYLEGGRCKYCKESRGARKIRKYLENNQYCFKQEYRMKECRYKHPLPFDFMVKVKNNIILIEFDGLEHYEPIKYFGGLDKFNERKRNDDIKSQYCKNNNIKLIRIPYWEYDNINEILDKELNLE